MARVTLKTGGLIIAVAMLFGCGVSPQSRRDRHVAKGKELLQKQDYSRALLEFKNAARIKPDDAEIYYQMGLALSAARDYRAAYQAFQKAAALKPNYAAAQLRIAQLELASADEGSAKEANTRLKALLENNAATPEMLNTLAFTELKLGNTNTAIQTFERALAESPGELLSALMLAQNKFSQKDPKGAEEILKKACADAPKSADARRILGEFYAVQNRMTDAEREFRTALTLSPKNGAVLMDLGRLELMAGRKQQAGQAFKELSALEGYQTVYATFLYQQGRHGEALREFEKLAKDNPDDREIRTNLIVAYRLTNRGAEADKILNKVLEKNPRDVDALLQRSEVFLERAKYEEAEADLNRVLKLKPNAPEAHYVLARLYLAQGKMLVHRQELTEALRLNPALLQVRVELMQSLVNAKEARAALALLDAAPVAQRSSLPVLIQRNWAFWVLGDLVQMRKGIDQGLAQERLPDLLIQDGLWKLRSGHPERARAALEEALKINPSDLRALQVLQQTYVAEKNGTKALQRIKEYAATQPKSAPIQDFLGLLLMANGETAQARTAFKKAKAVDPSFLNADLSLIQLDAAEGKFDVARQKLADVLASDSGNLTARRWIANIEAIRGDQNAAIEHFQKVIAADPNDAQASNNLAYLLAEYRNDNDRALKLAQKAVEIAPTSPEFCDTLGWVLYRKGLYDSAIKYLEQAGSNSTNVVWKYHLGMAYAKAGNMERGRSVLQAALKANPNVAEAGPARELLQLSK